MGKEGFEPSRSYLPRLLRPMRLPFRHFPAGLIIAGPGHFDNVHGPEACASLLSRQLLGLFEVLRRVDVEECQVPGIVLIDLRLVHKAHPHV